MAYVVHWNLGSSGFVPQKKAPSPSSLASQPSPTLHWYMLLLRYEQTVPSAGQLQYRPEHGIERKVSTHCLQRTITLIYLCEAQYFRQIVLAQRCGGTSQGTPRVIDLFLDGAQPHDQHLGAAPPATVLQLAQSSETWSGWRT